MQDFGEVENLISNTVDFPMSEEKHRTCVKQGIDVELDDWKHTYDAMDSMLSHVLRSVMDELPEWARQYIIRCVFIPQLGFLILVTVDEDTGQAKYEGEGLEVDIWQQIFTNQDVAYYKTNRMSELDLEFGDLEGEIRGIVTS